MKIRFGTIADIDSIAQVNYTSWQETYRGIVDNSFLDSLTLEKYRSKWHSFFGENTSGKFILVAENEQGAVVGYCCAGKARKNSHQAEAEIYALYLLKQCHGMGIGKALFTQAIQELKGSGFKSLCILVLKDNPSAMFYRSFKPDMEELTKAKLGGKEYPEIVMGWSDLKIFNASPI